MAGHQPTPDESEYEVIDKSAGQAPAPSLRGFELAAFTGVWIREWVLFRRLWRSTTFSSVVEPTIYLLAFGFGLGGLIPEIDGFTYVEYVGTGTVATAVLFASVFAAMFNTFVKREFLKTYDSVLATPVDVKELMFAEASWLALKAGVYGNAPLLVAMAFGLQPRWQMIFVPFIAAITGLGFAFLGQWISSIVPSIDSFNYVTSAVITPLFLLAGTFFPLTNFPLIVQTLAQFNPLFHCVELVRGAAFGFSGLADVGHVLALVVFALLASWLSVRAATKKLID